MAWPKLRWCLPLGLQTSSTLTLVNCLCRRQRKHGRVKQSGKRGRTRSSAPLRRRSSSSRDSGGSSSEGRAVQGLGRAVQGRGQAGRASGAEVQAMRVL